MATWCTSDRVSVMAHVVRRETELQRERKSEKLTMRAHERLGCNQLKSRACRWAVALSEAQSIVTTHAPSPKRDHWCTMWPLAPPLKKETLISIVKVDWFEQACVYELA